MSSLLLWHNLLFIVPLVAGVLLVVAAALGVVDFESDVDVEADAEVDADVDTSDGEPSTGDSMWSLLGFGRVPLSLLLMMALLVFGGVGLSSNLVVSQWLHRPVAIGSVSFLAALSVALVSTGTLARVIARLLPTAETYASGKDCLVGEIGTAELHIDPDFGLANVADATGTLFKVRCHTESENLAKGSRVLLVDYDAEHDVFLVEKSPI